MKSIMVSSDPKRVDLAHVAIANFDCHCQATEIERLYAVPVNIAGAVAEPRAKQLGIPVLEPSSTAAAPRRPA